MGKLYIVGTPIGNLGDFSHRGIETLNKVDFIAAEDTRVTRKLLTRFEINTPLISYHEHNKEQAGEQIINRLQTGESCALVSDAGMPLISDPGENLVKLCAERQILVEVVPGPSAVISALAVSGLSTQRFSFEGFLSQNTGSRNEHLASLVSSPYTLVFYEAPHKLLSTLKDMANYFGQRQVSICRELTKIYEEVLRMTLPQAVDYYSEHAPRGEFVLVIEKATEELVEAVSLEEAIEMVLIRSKEESMSHAAKEVSSITGFHRSDLYKGALDKKEQM